MKTNVWITALAAVTILFSGKAPAADKVGSFGEINSYIGSGGHGHVFVGASVPFGAVQVGPNNPEKGWDWCSGYHYSDSIVIGFSQTHLNGTGCIDQGDIMMMPYTGDIRIQSGDQHGISGCYGSFYKHSNESVNPSCYTLKMDNGVNVQLTATAHVGFHKYSFPKGQTGRVIFNLVKGNGDQADSTYICLVDPYTIKGYRFSKGWSPRQKVFFVAKCNYPIGSLTLFDNDVPVKGKEAYGLVKGVVSFDKTPAEILFKVGISSVSTENARTNINREIPAWNFNAVVEQARKSWEGELAKIRIETKDAVQRQIFYTALYHCFIAPTRYSDVNGDFRGHNGKVYTQVPYTNYSTFSEWDTYRAIHPLFTIVQSDKVADMVNSMLGIFDQQGRLPIWPLAGGETDCMPGYSAVPIIADAYLKGIKGFDAERAFHACKVSATNPNQKGVPYLMEKGYIPCDKLAEATSIAMEYAVDDWGLAQMAKKMNKTSDYEYFAKRADYFKNYYDASVGFIRPKMNDGTWRTPYDPIRSIHGVGDFTEGNGWQYTFFAPQNPEGLIELMGGDDNFVDKLNQFFVVEGDMGEGASADITGLIGQYAHGNEPSHHAAYLYAFAGQQWRTAEKVRQIMNEFYTNQNDGLIGNEDCGQMSAWYILSSMGFYQVNPASGLFVFGSPLFDKSTISLPGNKTFTVEAAGNSATNIYIQKVELNGKPYTKSYILYRDIMAGGTLKFFMGSQPNKSFGAAKADRPVSAVL